MYDRLQKDVELFVVTEFRLLDSDDGRYGDGFYQLQMPPGGNRRTNRFLRNAPEITIGFLPRPK